MTAAIINAPWSTTEIVAERVLVRKWLEVWAKLEAMPANERVPFLMAHGFTPDILTALYRIVDRHRDAIVREIVKASA